MLHAVPGFPFAVGALLLPSCFEFIREVKSEQFHTTMPETTTNAIELYHGHIAESVIVKQTDHHELIAWDNQTITIDHYQYQDCMDHSLDHIRLTCSEARALRNFLNSEVVMQTLGLL
jgi:hypothetical protein